MNDSALPRVRIFFTYAHLLFASVLIPHASSAGPTSTGSSKSSSIDPDAPIAAVPLEIDLPAPKMIAVAEARKALDAFLDATTLDELLPLVANRELVEPEIRANHKDGKREPIAVEKIEFENSGIIPGAGLRADMYWVTAGDRKIPVSIEETKDGFKVDWAAFKQFHDADLETFLEKPEDPGGKFYTSLRRSHYFGDDMPNIAELYAFRIKSPIAPHKEGYVFLRKDNPEAKEILEQYRWGKEYRPKVELQWVKPKGGKPWIELTKIVSRSWRG